MNILELYVQVDDFWQSYAPTWHAHLLAAPGKHRHRASHLHPSEIMTILIAFHQSHYRTFKAYYLSHVQTYWQREFPTLVSYQRFVDLIPSVLVPLTAFLHAHLGTCTGLSFVDSTPLAVCKNPRIHHHRVFADQAARGKTSVGWFFGFKLHLVINDCGGLLAFHLTPGNVDDRTPVPSMIHRVFGKLFGDKGYISQDLFAHLWEDHQIQLITRLRKNMANALIDLTEKLLTRKRAIIEAVIGQLKLISQIEHSRHRSPNNFLVNLICGLIAYTLKPTKPSLDIDHDVLWAA